MDQQQMKNQMGNEAFGWRFAELTALWAVIYTISGRVGPQIPETMKWLAFILQAAVSAPVMTALRMTYKNARIDGMIRFVCRLLFAAMGTALVVLLVMSFR